jgi:hypothetical protein
MRVSMVLLAVLCAGDVPELLDEEVPAGALTGSYSAPRLAAAVTLRLDDTFPVDPTPITPQAGGTLKSRTAEPRMVLSTYAPAITRRYFEDARWGTEKTKGKGRELVIKSVALTVTPGPNYQAQVMVDRVMDGKRLGQGTGQGYASPDRSSERVAAGFAGPFAGLVVQDSMAPKAKKDAGAIRIAVLRALDSAVMQLGAYWANEQYAEELQRKALEQINKGKKK